MKKILLIVMITILIFTGCSNNKNVDNKEKIEGKINWYIEFDEDNDYILCNKEDKDIDNGICYIGNYHIASGKIEKNVSIELWLDHYYEDGGYIAVDIGGPRVINLERIEKYQNNILLIEKSTNEVYLVNLVKQIEYDFNKK